MSRLKVKRFGINNDLKLQSEYLEVEDSQPGDIALSEVREVLERGGIVDFEFLDRNRQIVTDEREELKLHWYKADGGTNYLNICDQAQIERRNAEVFKRK